MSNKKQTAVEWLINELDLFEQGRSEYYSKSAIINQSFRLEKQQIINDYSNGRMSVIDKAIIPTEQYYNETYEQ